MPNKKVICEFCHVPSRKDLVASHIRSKCMKGMALLLLREWAGGATVTPLKQFVECRPIQNIPIPSEMFEESCYWFGVAPRMYDDDESYSDYIRCQANLDAHQAFLTECLTLITLADVVTVQRELLVKSPEMTLLQRQYNTLRKEHEEQRDAHRLETGQKNQLIARLTEEAEDLRCSVDGETVGAITKQLKDLERAHHLQSKQLATVQARLKETDMTHQREVERLYEEHHIRKVAWEEDYERMSGTMDTLKRDTEKLKGNVLKEAQKLADKQEKEREKDKEKARRAKEKLKDDIILAKMKARRSSPKQKKKHYSSSSSSSSSSDSDSD